MEINYTHNNYFELVSPMTVTNFLASSDVRHTTPSGYVYQNSSSEYLDTFSSTIYCNIYMYIVHSHNHS